MYLNISIIISNNSNHWNIFFRKRNIILIKTQNTKINQIIFLETKLIAVQTV